MTAIALTIAGSDSGGGAGIQADLKTFSSLGVYGASVMTAVTAQNTRTVAAVHDIPTPMIAAQIETVLSDLSVDVIKIGMLATTEIIECVVDSLNDWTRPLIIDPVMIAKSGDSLLADNAVDTLRQKLLPRADVLTPNLPEAARLLDMPVATNPEEIIEQGQLLCDRVAGAVLMKGGHALGDDCTDILITGRGPDTIHTFTAKRQRTQNTHGTGCTLSSAIAATIARGLDLPQATQAAHDYLQQALAAADILSIGHGHGPVHHFWEHWEK